MYLPAQFLLKTLRHRKVYSFYQLGSVELIRPNKLVRSETTQCICLIVALGENGEGVTKTLMLINDRVANKTYQKFITLQ